MKRRKIIIVITVILLAFYFFAPVVYWFNGAGGPAFQGPPPNIPVYQSPGCATFGIGDLYAPSWFGFHLGCDIPEPIPV
jgi:hypothetical protein